MQKYHYFTKGFVVYVWLLGDQIMYTLAVTISNNNHGDDNKRTQIFETLTKSPQRQRPLNIHLFQLRLLP